MVMVKQKFPRLSDSSVDIEAWLENHCTHYSAKSLTTIRQSAELAKITSESNATFYGQSTFEEGLECAESLVRMHADATTVAAAIAHCSLQGTGLSLDDIADDLNPTTCKLMQSLATMETISTLHQQTNKTHGHQVDNLRKMLLAMVSDIRVVLITLAKRVCIMRGIQVLGDEERRAYAEETMDIFAPLANRLGISNIKWELEDLSFHDIDPSTYKTIAKQLNEKRLYRETRIQSTMDELKETLAKEHIKAEIEGRAKHIYSIYKKMQRKKVPFEEVYDTHAIRIIVDNIDECYKVLSLVHARWTAITEEFDDYISTPKPNGYQSIHTAVHGPDNKYLEIQIRTHQMHEDNELGGAAHWMYKEGVKDKGGYEQKIAWLRELLSWHKELSHGDEQLDRFHDQVFEDRVYVFTPNGDIIDLILKSTPLDFAYHIHSEVGHRCKGAKVNEKMVPLTYQLKTGDRIEVITAKEPRPSRDWLNPEQGYIASSKARAKVHQWFKQLDSDKNTQEGKQIVDKELQRLHVADKNIDLTKIANELNCKTADKLYEGIACGNLKLTQIAQAIKDLYPTLKLPEKTTPKVLSKPQVKPKQRGADIAIYGISNLLTHIAPCCNPIPGDPIIGYITRGKGVSIHHTNCKNISNLTERGTHRLVEAEWGSDKHHHYIVDMDVETTDGQETSQALVSLLAAEKVQMLSINEKRKSTADQETIALAIHIDNVSGLNKLIGKIKQLPHVKGVKRSNYHGVET